MKIQLLAGLVCTCLVFSTAYLSANEGPCSSEERRQFDFWLGEWTAYSKDGKKLGTNKLTSVMDGCAMQENWQSANGTYRGTSYNFYVPDRDVWHQTWVDMGGGHLLLEGRFESGSMRLEGERKDKDGNTVIDRITWTPLEDGRVRQHWQMSSDEGSSWQDAFDGYYQRDEP